MNERNYGLDIARILAMVGISHITYSKAIYCID